jgi:hypothetical protein
MFDDDAASTDIVGSMYFSLKQLLAKGAQEGGYYWWQNLYGAPVS